MFNFEDALKLIGEQTVLCVGDLMLDDFVYGEVVRISPEAPAPVLAVTRNELVVGGGGNVARNLAAPGASCFFGGCGRLGRSGRKAGGAPARGAPDRAASGGRRDAPDHPQGSLCLRALFDP